MNIERIDRLRQIVAEKPFYRSLWGLKEQFFYADDCIKSWENLAKCVPYVEPEEKISYADRFIGTLIHHIERFKVAFCEKRVVRFDRLDYLEEEIRKCVNDFVPSTNNGYIDKINRVFEDFYYGGGPEVLVSERAHRVQKENGIEPILVKCEEGEELFFSRALLGGEYLNFDLLLTSEQNRNWLVDRYIQKFREIQRRFDEPLTICFRKKYAGAYGVFRLFDEFKSELPRIPMAVYSQTLKTVDFLTENKSDKFVLFADVVVTGHGIVEWNKCINEKKYGSVPAIIILTKFGNYPKDLNYSEDKIWEIDFPRIDSTNIKERIEIKEAPYSYEEIDGTFVEPKVENLFLPKKLKEQILS